MSGSDPAAVPFVFTAQNYLKATHKPQVMERGGKTESPQKDSRIKFCSFCRRGFESSKALYGHLRIHIISQARSKTEILRINSPKRGTKRSLEEDEGFGCLVCTQSFSSTQLLCRHMRIHRGTVSNGVQQPPATSQESTLFPSNDHSDIIHDAVPLRFYHRPAEQTWKKKKSEESMAYQDTLMEGAAADCESTVEQFSKLKIVTSAGLSMEEDQ